MSALAPVDYSPLRRAAPPAVVARFSRGLHAGLRIVEWIGLCGVAALAVAVAVLMVVQDASPLGCLLAGAVLLACLVGGAWFALRNTTRARLRARTAEFARVNGFDYLPGEIPRVQGSTTGLFRLGEERTWSELVRGERARPFAFFSYRYSVITRDAEGRRRRAVHEFTAARIALARALPPIFGQRRRGFDLPRPDAPFWPREHSGKLSLEGDFDTHFTVRITPGREADALYVLAPDVMADLVDHLADFSFEVADDVLWFYRAGSLDLADAAAYREILEAVDTVGARIGRISERYTDA